MFAEKRGQAAGAAVFVAIVAALLVAFIILVDPQERAELLGESTTTTSTSTAAPVSGSLVKTLLKTTPGRIDYLSQKEIEHPLPVATIQTKTETRIIAEKNLARAKKALFSEKEDQFTFSLVDLAHTENVLLSFKVKSQDSDLILSLNGEEILRARPDEKIKPVFLPKNLLEAENTLTVAASSPGAAFWRTNEVVLENLQVVADVTSLEAQSSKNVFLISEVEKKNLERVVLKFQPQCVYDRVGPLSIFVNGHEIYNAVPDCDLAMIPLELSPDYLNQGENQVVFSTGRGMYILSHITIVSRLKEIDFPTYYFELSAEDFKTVGAGKLKVRLAMSFVDVVATKSGDLFFNGHRLPFDTKDVVFSVDVNNDVVQGNNAIKITPKKMLEIRELRVDLIK